MSAGRIAELEFALQSTLNLLAPSTPAGVKAQETAKKVLLGRQPPRHQWVSREELLEALDEVPTPTAKALARVLRRE